MIVRRVMKHLNNMKISRHTIYDDFVKYRGKEVSEEWAHTMLNVCYYRVNNKWTGEQHSQIRDLLRANRKDLKTINEHSKFPRNPFIRHTWLSGSQFMLDDFPYEMDWMLDQGSLFERTKWDILTTEDYNPQNISTNDEGNKEEFLLCINTSHFPPHHVWWKNKAQLCRFDVIINHFNQLLEVQGSQESEYFNQFYNIVLKVFHHRLAYNWTSEQHKQIQGILQKLDTSMLLQTAQRLLGAGKRGSFYLQMYLSGLQFLLDDFPYEMSWLLAKEAKFEEPQKRLERMAKEGPDPFIRVEWPDVGSHKKPVQNAVKPAHHTWWQHEIIGRNQDDFRWDADLAIKYLLDLPSLNPLKKIKFKSSGPVMIRSFLHTVYKYRLENEWNGDDCKKIQALLQAKREELKEYCSVTLGSIHKESSRWEHKDALNVMLGCQYLLKDFPTEMDWLLENGKNSKFERAQQKLRMNAERDLEKAASKKKTFNIDSTSRPSKPPSKSNNRKIVKSKIPSQK